jgi:uncharacterized protein YndB with AHSA1/START domain
MALDVENHLGSVERSVSSPERDGQPARSVTLTRSYATTVEDLWDAVTNSERIPRWFLPVSGELEYGGRYQLEGNAGGEITACEPLSHFALTWEFGEDVSWVEARFSEDGAGSARLTLTHTAYLSEHWSEYGPGAVGVGWELGLMGLAIHIAQPTEPMPDEVDFATSPDGKAFITGSSQRWGHASVAAGTDPDAAGAAARRTTAFYTGEPIESV